MCRDYEVYLDDILVAIDKIAKFTVGMSQEEFTGDAKTFDAVIRNLEIIGEAAKRLPEKTRSACSRIDWRKIAGLRDVLIHQYATVDAEVIWGIVQNKLPVLRQQVRDIPSQ